MHELTIATDDTTNTTPYNDFDDAFRALMSHVIAHDLYLHAKWPTPRTATAFTLVHLDEAARQSRIIGTATIAPTAGKPVVAPYYSATAALRWTAQHTSTYEFGCDTDPGGRYPLAVLTAARAEARNSFTAGNIYPEAASLSDAGSPDVPRPTQHTFERLRDNAIHAARNRTITTPAELAAAVAAQLTPDTTAEQTAALIWYYALILWAASAP
ncbi:hypothetical protein [Mycolicibacterium chlorophenolicum]|uniref:Uncharacterized protein n=1 Tax=Mycolicibacterium chlorophenolicum TaxID=37916 RepID=A0A0J6VK56_9MYCO|nr:hypothetical protein [Mycolicibacterium chlorophenolicum]KMO69843.1 hypothetical protein MCHLDSM_05955 [Mycolicibacterium chlorophenolicum]